jgi:hypothetical protein
MLYQVETAVCSGSLMAEMFSPFLMWVLLVIASSLWYRYPETKLTLLEGQKYWNHSDKIFPLLEIIFWCSANRITEYQTFYFKTVPCKFTAFCQQSYSVNAIRKWRILYFFLSMRSADTVIDNVPAKRMFT